MLKALHLKQTSNNPGIILDHIEGKIQITGRSIQEDATAFYAPIQEWIDEYVKNPNKSTEVTIKMEYINSASTKKMVKLFLELEKIMEIGNEICVKWYYEDGDEIIRERGEEIDSIVDIPFIYLSF